ncbi:hypothetical protein KVP70_34035, partial [Duganella sp. HSC-15S17]
ALRELFAHPTLSALAAVLEHAQRNEHDQHGAPLAAITPTGREQAPPLSLAQQRLWFLAQLDAAAGAAY